MDRQVDGRTRRPSEFVCDAFVLSFAAWTILCNLCVLAGFRFTSLLIGTATTLGIGAVVISKYGLGRRDASSSLSSDQATGSPLCARAGTLFALGTAVAACTGIHVLSDWQPVWWLLVGYFALVCGTGLAGEVRIEPATDSVGRSWALAALAALCMFVTLIAHRPNEDDCFYLNLAVAAVDNPHEPLMAHDTLHGDPTLPLLLPTYRVHSFELMIAALSQLTRLPVIAVAHLLLPPLLAALACLAWAGMLRLLAPREWMAVLLTMAGIYLAVGANVIWYTNFGFWRLFQGKAALVTIAVPLVIRAALRLRLAPTYGNWVLLTASQIAAVGFSSTALWLAPSVAALTTLAVATPGRKGLAQLAWGWSASWYPALLALFFMGQKGTLPSEWRTGIASTAMWQTAAKDMLGAGWLREASLVALILAWRAAHGSLGRRLAAGLPLLCLLTFLNPYLASWFGQHVVGSPTYWRAWWLLPIPLFLALVLAWPTAARWSWPCRWLVPAVFLVLAPPFGALSSQNHVRLGWPSLKVDPQGYEAAALLANRPDLQRQTVLAPLAVSVWLPTFHQHPYPLVCRDLYLMVFREQHQTERQRRLALVDYVSGAGDPSVGRGFLIDSLQRDHLRGVCLVRSCPWASELAQLLPQAGFRLFGSNELYDFWEKEAPDKREPLQAAISPRWAYFATLFPLATIFVRLQRFIPADTERAMAQSARSTQTTVSLKMRTGLFSSELLSVLLYR